MHRWLLTRARRYLFAVLVTVCALIASALIGTGRGSVALMPFFPALLAIIFYAGIAPAVGCWVIALLWAALWPHAPNGTEIWALGVFGTLTALSVAICIGAQRAAFEERAELRVLEQQAQHDVTRAVTSKNELLSKLSHELRTPLSAIIGWTQVLRAQTPPAQVAHGLEIIERNARAQTRIIEDLIDANQPRGQGTDSTSSTELKQSKD